MISFSTENSPKTQRPLETQHLGVMKLVESELKVVPQAAHVPETEQIPGINMVGPNGKTYDIPASSMVFKWQGDDSENGTFVVQAPKELLQDFSAASEYTHDKNGSALIGKLYYTNLTEPAARSEEGIDNPVKQAGLLFVEGTPNTVELEQQLEVARTAGVLAVWTVARSDS